MALTQLWVIAACTLVILPLFLQVKRSRRARAEGDAGCAGDTGLMFTSSSDADCGGGDAGGGCDGGGDGD